MATGVQADAFLERAKEASEVIRQNIEADSAFTAISHNDADGLSSAGIVASLLARNQARFKVRIVEELREDIVDEISLGKPDIVIFTDIGSGYSDLVNARLEVKRVVVMDHHPPDGKAGKKITQVNPHEFGIDGATKISAAGVAYLVARSVNDGNKDLSTLGIVGALGDMQDKNEARTLAGLNQILVDDAVGSGCARVDSDLVIYGRETRPIFRALAYTTSPYLPNLSGREDNCLTLLSNAGIPLKDGDRFRTVADLSQEEKQKLLNAIISYLTSQGFPSNVVLDMVGSVYTFVNEPAGSPTRDGREFSALLNACGRTGNPSIGVSIGLGDREGALSEASEVVSNYRKTLANYMDWLTKSPNAIQKFKIIWAIRGEEHIQETMTGAFSSIISSAGNLTPDHAIIVVTKAKDGGIKLSARAPAKLLQRGMNLGEALNVTAKKYEGIGGGHNVAAGAHIKAEDPTQFLEELDQVLLSQLKIDVPS
ncbi:MAG TPA: DHH family phosphoesterase [Candidatus Acidoferrales bacterium]|nr:DHH family phosphoesterase [Candidatus Acidoferrales bacterium]